MTSKKLVLVTLFAILALAFACGDGSPSIASVTPNHASTRGGDLITITGSGFGTHPVVRFGPATGVVQSATDESLTVITPAHVEGVVDVEVDVGASSARLVGALTFARYDMTFVDTSWTHLDPLAVNGAGVAAADLDGDGAVDLVQAAGTEGVWIYTNDGHGNFPNAVLLAAPDPLSNVVGVVAADFDGDKATDLFFATTGATHSALLLNDGKGHFTPNTTGFPVLFGTAQSAIAVDYDGDGAMDLVTLGSALGATNAPAIMILANRGKTFVDVTATALTGGSFATTGVAAADVDHDGDVDLVFGAATDPCRIYVNDGHGVFQHGSVDALPSDALAAGVPAFGDLDGDGFVDLYIPSSGQDRVLVNDGTGRFRDLTALRLGPETANGVSATIVDLDHDGHADVVVVEQPGALRMYRNDGTGRLFDYSAQIVGADGTLTNAAVAIADVDADGDPDIFVSRSGAARAALLTNWTPLAMDDTDGDGVPDLADSCPTIANASQANVDSLPFRCVSEDACKVATKCDLKVFRASAYLVCSGVATWASAQAACVARGANLVTVDDASEGAFLTALLPSFWSAADKTGTGSKPFACEDLRARAPDPGDACDPCPNDYDPKDHALTSIPDAGADAADASHTSTCP